jgi:hypothetical protein
MSTNSTHGAGDEAPSQPDFDPVPVRYRRDGWTPERQVGFIRALAECGCVREACRRVGMSSESAYELARRPDAQSFRVAWDVAMDQAVRRLADGAFGRALNGVEIPHYYRGELVGTHRRYDERLTMFILRTRDPQRFGRDCERGTPEISREGRALDFANALAWVRTDAEREAAGLPRTVVAPPAANDDDRDGPSLEHVYDFAPTVPPGPDDDDGEDMVADPGCEDEKELSEEEEAALEERAWAAVRAAALAREDSPSEEEIDAHIAFVRWRSACGPERGGRDDPPPPDVPRTSSTSASGPAGGPGADDGE